MKFLLFVAFAYLLGSIPCGVVASRLLGLDDPRGAGSGNIGATNVGRLHGKKAGLATLGGDVFKGWLPAFIALQAFSSPWAVSAVALAAYLGHIFPLYLGFKGGKGVATGLGVFLALAPCSVLAAVFVFAATAWKWRMVSLSSLTASAILPLMVVFFADSLEIPPFAMDDSLAVATLALVVGGVSIWKHQANIERILSGSEPGFKGGEKIGTKT